MEENMGTKPRVRIYDGTRHEANIKMHPDKTLF